MRKAGARQLVSLRVTIATLFVTLVLVSGLVLGLYNYHLTSTILYDNSNRHFTQIGNEIRVLFNGTQESVARIVTLVAHSQAASATTLEERLRCLPLMTAVLEETPQLSGLQIGYGNGDYFIVRPMTNPVLRQRFQPPDGAVFNVDSIQPGPDQHSLLTRIWFDGDLHELDRMPPRATLYDPRQRPWYLAAQASGAKASSDPYLFYFTGKVGITISSLTPKTATVVAADVILDQLSELLISHPLARDNQIVVLADDGRMIASTDPQSLIIRQDESGFELATLQDLPDGPLKYFGSHLFEVDRTRSFGYQGEEWFVNTRRLNLAQEHSAVLVMLTGKGVLLADAVQGQVRGALISLLIVLLACLASWFLSRRISAPISQLAEEAKRVSRFDFQQRQHEASHIREVSDLVQAMSLMKGTINRFLTLIQSLAEEKDLERLLADIGRQTMRACLANGVVVYLVDRQNRCLRPGAAFDDQENQLPLEEFGSLSVSGGLTTILEQGGGTVLELTADTDDGLTQQLLQAMGQERLSALALPLTNRQQEKVGLLCLLYQPSRKELVAKQDQLAFVRALSRFAAVSLESRQLLRMQKRLFQALVKLIAGAIDAKSPYTGAHCQRVPVLTTMLAEAVCVAKVPPFTEYTLNEQQWEELHIASWLHDCGKVTTPEHVVDKATKLQTLYDRIHEVRTRFEVVKRDAEIRFWQRLADGGNRPELERQLAGEWQQLDEDFAFVAACNIGGEELDADSLARLEQISRRTWQRTLDDRLGIGWEERSRKEQVPPSSLPVVEGLLQDRLDHLIPRPEHELLGEENSHGFRLQVPRYKYNLGELYNLSVRRGTLTEEERYLINDHIVQTILILDRLPYPPHLSQVPDIAGSHHEKMDGTGYPRRLKAEQQSLTARMMAIADVFEALTASDRPYKRAKTLSQAVAIMAKMAETGHLDPDLFRLFCSSGIHQRYAQQYLRAEQIDRVDLQGYG